VRALVPDPPRHDAATRPRPRQNGGRDQDDAQLRGRVRLRPGGVVVDVP